MLTRIYKYLIRSVLLLLAATLLTPTLPAQVTVVRWQDSSAVAIMRSMTSIKQYLLRQTDGPVSRAILDEVADSLVRRASKAAEFGTPGYSQAESAMLDVVGSGTVDEPGGVAYPGAQSALIRIARESSSPYIMRSAHFFMLGIGSFDSATAFLASEALQPEESDSTRRESALQILSVAWEAGQRGTGQVLTVAELAVVREALRKIWYSTAPRDPKGPELSRQAKLYISRPACLEGWLELANPCTSSPPHRVPGAPPWVAPVRQIGGGPLE